VSLPRRIEHGERSGVVVEYTRRTQTMRVWGWHDGTVTIEGFRMPLRDFLADLGITPRDVRAALDDS